MGIRTINRPLTVVDLYCGIGIAAFIAAGYKTPLAAVAFVAETTGTPLPHSSAHRRRSSLYVGFRRSLGLSSQRLRQIPKLSQPVGLSAREIMRTPITPSDIVFALSRSTTKLKSQPASGGGPIQQGKWTFLRAATVASCFIAQER